MRHPGKATKTSSPIAYAAFGSIATLIIVYAYSATFPDGLETPVTCVTTGTDVAVAASGIKPADVVVQAVKENYFKVISPGDRAQYSKMCNNDCNLAKGWGECDKEAGRCKCSPGHGDLDCSLFSATLYGEHDIYEGLELRPLDATGWDMGGELYSYLVNITEPNLVIEVGVWKGSSALKLSQALKAQGRGLFIGVDTWLPVKNFWMNRKAYNRETDLHFMHGWPTLFYTFTGNLVHGGVKDYAIPFPASSRTASDFLYDRKTRAELIHIDAAHEYIDVKEDLALWWRLLVPGGIMLGDDWSGSWPGVVKAVREHAAANNLSVKVYNNKWWIKKSLQ